MKVLMIHKFYYIDGGAERYYFNLSQLLGKQGVEVIPFSMKHPRNLESPYSSYFVDYFEPDKELANLGLWNGLKAAARVIFNVQAQKRLERLIDDVQPDVAHVHGVYHHLSPSVLWTLKKKKIPVVFTLHEYKILCPAYLFLDGKGNVCEKCQGKYFWHCILNRCFRQSIPASILVSVESGFHRLLNTYIKTVDRFLSPSQFLMNKMIQYGYAAEHIQWLPYTIPIEEYQPNYNHKGYFVYVGRLSREKGILELVHAMKHVPEAQLKVIGTGRLQDEIDTFIQASGLKNVEMMGYQQGEALRNLVRNAQFVAVPSVVYDNSPLSIYEAFAHGKPVVGATIGGIPELIDEDKDGFLFQSGNENELVDCIRRMTEKSPEEIKKMGEHARQKAVHLFAPEQHIEKILDIYKRLISK